MTKMAAFDIWLPFWINAWAFRLIVNHNSNHNSSIFLDFLKIFYRPTNRVSDSKINIYNCIQCAINIYRPNCDFNSGLRLIFKEIFCRFWWCCTSIYVLITFDDNSTWTEIYFWSISKSVRWHHPSKYVVHWSVCDRM